jgi:hypothetical protein
VPYRPRSSVIGMSLAFSRDPETARNNL